ncbi:hypothetical protein DNU06_16030 [Putridiphycobacter roseus]|uniref:Lipoprotein n=1 Tax=Putridiphycobacter roseus TaxID=2219161 RepID=A0A2W1MVN8_9FLAO|nr:hypothetical protein [Putridiphycobacter roseus]PZE15887.1 hypothetical protein DNU06_16030 [Putridiphycobacter roseus]
MKNLIFSITIFTLIFASCNKDADINQTQSSCDFKDFKYYNGIEHYLGELSNDYVLIGIDTTNSDIEIQNFISTVKQLDQNYEYTIHNSSKYKFKEIPVKFKASKSCEEITQIISDLEQNKIVSYIHFTMQTDNCQNAIWEPVGKLCVNSYGSIFYVKLFDENDLNDLIQMISETNTELVGQNESMPKWYELSATKHADGDALKMANHFYESGLFEQSEPSISKYPVE